MLRGGTKFAKCTVPPKFSAVSLKPSIKVSKIPQASIKPTANLTLKHSTQHQFRSLQFFAQTTQTLRFFSTTPQNTEPAEHSTEPKIEIFGNNVPKPIPTFDAIPNFPPELQDNVKAHGWQNLIKVQQYAIPAALANRDLLISSQTGTGKTAAFLIPMLMNVIAESRTRREPQSRLEHACLPRGLVLVPTRELAQQVYKEAEKLAQGTDIKAFPVFGGTSLKTQVSQIYLKRPDIIIATPGRFIDLRARGVIGVNRVNHVVLDEGDMMLDMGFMPSVRDILDDPNFNPNRQLMFFSATFPKPIREIAEELLRDPIQVFVGLNKPSALITQKVVYVTGNSEKESLLLDFVRSAKGRILVFTETKKRTDALFFFLRFQGVKVACIHGDHAQTERDLAVEAFVKGTVDVLVATNVASRGLDIKGVSHVVNYDMPQGMEPYIHRIGRTGRAGVPGTALTFFGDQDFALASDLKHVLQEAKQEIPDFLKTGERPRYAARNIGTPDDGFMNPQTPHAPQTPPTYGRGAPFPGYNRPGQHYGQSNYGQYPRQGGYNQRPGYQQGGYNQPYQQGGYNQQQPGYQQGYRQPSYGSRPSYPSYGSQPSYPPPSRYPPPPPQYSAPGAPPPQYSAPPPPPPAANPTARLDFDLMSLLKDNSNSDNKQQ